MASDSESWVDGWFGGAVCRFLTAWVAVDFNVDEDENGGPALSILVFVTIPVVLSVVWSVRYLPASVSWELGGGCCDGVEDEGGEEEEG